MGQIIEPSDPQTYDDVCIGGWSGVESDGVWSEADRASLRVLLAAGSVGPLAVWAAVKPFNPDGHTQTIRIRCDGVDMGQAALAAEDHELLILQIVQGGPASARSHIRLELDFPARLSPAAAGLSDDQRELGLQLQGLVVTAATDAPPPSFAGEAIRFEPAAFGERRAAAFLVQRSEPSWGPTLELLVRQLADADASTKAGGEPSQARLQAAVAALQRRVDTLADEARLSRRLLEQMHDQLTVAVRRSDELLLQSSELVRRGVVPLSDDAVACRTPHGHVLADARDPAPLLVLADTGDLEPGARRFLERFVQPGMQAVDAGANLGVHTLALARLVGAGGRVHAFEPEPRNLALLRRTLALNGVEAQVEVHGVALSDLRGVACLHLGARGGLHSLYPLHGNLGSVEIETTTLDHAFAHAPPLDLLKADVEGAEIALLKGAEALVGRSPDLVIMAEYAPTHLERADLSGEQWFAAFQAQGFDRAFVVDEPDGAIRTFDPEAACAVPAEASLNLVFTRSASRHLPRIEAQCGSPIQAREP